MFRQYPQFMLFPYTTLFRSPQKSIVGADYMRVHVSRCSPGLWIVSHVSADPYAGFCKQVHRIVFKNFVFSGAERSEEHTSELQSQFHLVCRLLLEKNKQ